MTIHDIWSAFWIVMLWAGAILCWIGAITERIKGNREVALGLSVVAVLCLMQLGVLPS